MQTLVLVNMDDLRKLLAEKQIKNELWNLDEASEYLKCSRATLAKQAAKGLVPACKVGTDWKFSSIALFHLVSGGTLKQLKQEATQ